MTTTRKQIAFRVPVLFSLILTIVFFDLCWFGFFGRDRFSYENGALRAARRPPPPVQRMMT